MAPVHTPCSRHRRPSWHHPCSQKRPTSSDCQRNQWPVAPIEVNNLLTFWMPWLGSCFPKVSRNLHPWNLTWNLKRSPWKRRFLLETIIFRFHVKFRGCIQCPLIGLLFFGLIILETKYQSPTPCNSAAKLRFQWYSEYPRMKSEGGNWNITTFAQRRSIGQWFNGCRLLTWKWKFTPKG